MRPIILPMKLAGSLRVEGTLENLPLCGSAEGARRP